MDLKKGFDMRCQEFKKQIEEFKQNNEAIEALKKAHAKEIAAHVQESNKKYNELLTEKLNSEDKLKADFVSAKAALIKEWQQKCEETALLARAQERDTAKANLAKTDSEYNSKVDELTKQIEALK